MKYEDIDSKLILTIDLDAFFAQAEEQRHPEFKGKAMGVGHELNGRGIVATSNYKARSFGIKSGMPLFKARELCPDFILVESDHEYYQSRANDVFNTISKYADKIEFASIDECYVDATSSISKYKPLQIAKMIFEDVYKTTGLTVSIGVSTNILLSKMASNFDKPQGISTLYKHEIPVKFWPLHIQSMHMVGGQTAKKFIEEGINTVGDLAKLKDNPELYNKMKQKLGIVLDKHIDAANGKSSDVVNPEESLLKSISRSKTFPTSITDYQLMMIEARELFDYVVHRSKYRHLMPSSIHIALKVDKSFNTTSRSKRLKIPTLDTNVLWPIVVEAMETLFIEGNSYKYCSISFNDLKELAKTYRQLEIGEDGPELKEDKLQWIAEDTSRIFKTNVVSGSTMKDNRYYEKKQPVDRDNIKFKSWDK